MKDDYSPCVLFVTTVSEKEQVKLIQMLIDSIRTFGGSLQDSEIWIFDSSSHADLCGSMAASNVKTFPLKIDSFLEGFPFAGKVTACARAEEKIEDQHLTLVWISQDCLVVNPPQKHILFPPHRAAFRPVHIQNVGSRWDEPMDEYWKEIYHSVEMEEAPYSIESYLDRVKLRPYFNTHTFSVDPAAGLMKRWLDLFQHFVQDPDFQAGPCEDVRKKIFLHQAVLSALVASELNSEEIFHLSPHYSYPYNLQADLPEQRRIRDLKDLVSFTWEGRRLDPHQVEDMHIGEPYRSWLEKYHR